LRAINTVGAAEKFGRTRLSRSFFMREFLYSEVANLHGLSNLPSDPDLTVAAGQQLCEQLLEPLQATFGRIALRSGYRSREVNGLCNDRYGNCGSNERNRARHIWDERSEDGGMGAMVTIAIPWLIDRVPSTPWQAMAWWIHDHLPYSELQFFPRLLAFNISWHEHPKRHIMSFAPPRGVLTKPGIENHAGDHRSAYRGFPSLTRPLRAPPRKVPS
jgi:hypothetical protein